MSYQVIARKWRPQIFEEVIGQEAITQTLRNAIEYDRLHHAYLFSGARGVGKTTTARLLAKALNCQKTEKPNQTPCNTDSEDACDSCLEVAESRSLDVLEFDAASHTKVDEIREIILESITVNPARDRYKIFIIDEVHMLSKSSFNALLKTLEEPPPNVVFIMATTELHKVPDTILSRCQEFEFRTIALKKIFDRLKTIAKAEDIGISDDGLKEIARSGEGSMRDAQSNFDQVISFSGEKIDTDDVLNALGIASAENLTKILGAISNQNLEQVFTVVDDLVGRGHDLRNFCRDLLGVFRDLLVAKITANGENLLESAILSHEEMKSFAMPFAEADLVRFFNSLAETELKIRDSSEPRYLLEIGLVKLIEMRRIKPIEDVLQRLVKLENLIAKRNDSRDLKTTETASSAVAEKKTLTPDETVEIAASETKTAKVSDDAKRTTASAAKNEKPTPVIPRAAKIAPSSFEDKEKVEESIFKPSQTAAAVKPKKINLEKMPVKLAPIEAEELEHVADKKLDKAYEKRLQKEGDNLKFIKNARKIVDALINPNGKNTNIRLSKTIEQSSSTTSRRRTKEKNRALNIVSKMAEVVEIDDTIPELPEDLSDQEAIRKYAESHPLVKRVMRVFRGTIVKTEIPSK